MDASAVVALSTSLKLAGEMAKALIGIRDGAMLQAKVIELQGVILAAQSSALAAQSDQLAILDRVRNLEAEIAKLKDWETEKNRYQLHELAPGVPAYTVKPEMQGSEPTHHLCANCYNQQKKRPLHLQAYSIGRAEAYICDDCGSRLYVSGHYYPEHDGKKR